ncbi:helix-turn-helix transcriptional regulator [Streptomyces sp. ODS28]|uniref:helix-turn-helix domain-containing protein n=1 Tax=Streptomyces sp. ODS28 TaxID=3136688 RepID=UPI0031F16372
MSAEVGGSGVPEDEEDPRRRFAEECRSARELYPERALTQGDLARMTRTSKSTISRVERCEGPIPPALPPLLDQVFATDGKFKRLHAEITAQSFPAHARRRIELEPRAVAIAEWSPTVVPGLLQTPAYAWALFREGDPRASDKELATRVGNRMARQKMLEGGSPPDTSVIVCESVIRRKVGDEAVMREQLASLLEHTARPTTVLQVLPLSAGTHGLMDGAMSILTTADGATVVYTEGVRSGAIIEEPADVRHLSRSYDVLTASALSRDASAQMIRELMEA